MPMTTPFALAVALLGSVVAGRAVAQGSPYIPLDDPRLPLIEHLITRGDIDDPSPMIRPLRRADVVRALRRADSARAASDDVRTELRTWYTDPASELWYAVEPRGGAQIYTEARRDPLHPAGPDGIDAYVEGRGDVVFGNVVLASRPAGEGRLADDPDWPGREEVSFPARLIEGYAAAQFRFAELLYGQLDRNWGPVGVPGIPISGIPYERQGLAFEIGSRDIRFWSLASDLQDETDSSGQPVHRYLFLHRLAVRVSDRLRLAAWEGIVISGADRNFETRFRNPLSISFLANTIGLGDRGNVILGLDVSWRAVGRTTVQGQLAVDDIQYKERSGPRRYPDRYAFTVAAFGPLGSRLGWRALYTQASSLAFRTLDPFENYTDTGLGIGRNFADNDQLTLLASLPVQRRWLLQPELTLLRQGEGRLATPFPPDRDAAGATPTLFIGTIERTYRAALNLSGTAGPLHLQASGGIHRVSNAAQASGANDTRFVGRIQATLGFRHRGTFR